MGLGGFVVAGEAEVGGHLSRLGREGVSEDLLGACFGECGECGESFVGAAPGFIAIVGEGEEAAGALGNVLVLFFELRASAADESCPGFVGDLTEESG